MFIIAVLAIIAAAIAAASGGFNENTTTEGGKVNASTIIQVAGQLQESMQKVMSHGCADTQVNFNNPIISGYSNPNAPSDGSCDMFGSNGGSISFPMITASTTETNDGGHFVFEGSNVVFGFGTGVGDLVAFLPIDSLTLCQQINTELGLGSAWGGDWYYSPSTATYGRFTGTYIAGNLIEDDAGAWPTGKMMGCLEEAYNNGSSSYLYRSGTSSPLVANYFFYVVLLVR